MKYLYKDYLKEVGVVLVQMADVGVLVQGVDVVQCASGFLHF